MPLAAIVAHQNNLVFGGVGRTGVDTEARRRRRREDDERLAVLLVLSARGV